MKLIFKKLKELIRGKKEESVEQEEQIAPKNKFISRNPKDPRGRR
jgi:hypothetical protein